LDHAPAAFINPDRVGVSQKWVGSSTKRAAIFLRYHGSAQYARLQEEHMARKNESRASV